MAKKKFKLSDWDSSMKGSFVDEIFDVLNLGKAMDVDEIMKKAGYENVRKLWIQGVLDRLVASNYVKEVQKGYYCKAK